MKVPSELTLLIHISTISGEVSQESHLPQTHTLKLQSSSVLIWPGDLWKDRYRPSTMFSDALMGFLVCALSPRLDVSEATT